MSNNAEHSKNIEYGRIAYDYKPKPLVQIETASYSRSEYGRYVMNQGQQPCAYGTRRLIDSPIPLCRWRSHAERYAQLLDVSHLIHVCGSVDRGMSDLRQ